MEIKYIGEDCPGYFLKNKIYEVKNRQIIYDTNGVVVPNIYRIIDESEEDYLYCLGDKSKFEWVIDEEERDLLIPD